MLCEHESLAESYHKVGHLAALLGNTALLNTTVIKLISILLPLPLPHWVTNKLHCFPFSSPDPVVLGFCSPLPHLCVACSILEAWVTPAATTAVAPRQTERLKCRKMPQLPLTKVQISCEREYIGEGAQ